MERKARGYIVAGVTAVMVVVPEDETATVYRLNEFHQTFHNGDELTLPDVLPGFAVPVKRFFE
jgi:Uma2 family endonuclease